MITHRTFLTVCLIFLCVGPSMGLEIIQVANVSEFQSALATVGDGGIIEMLSGTYVAPAGGFLISNAGKSLTIREASGATVILTGSGTKPILIQINSAAGSSDSVVYQNLTFDNGFSNVNGTGAGVTVSAANATFLGCTFQNNVAAASTTGGGGVFAWGASAVHFSDCVWNNNTSTIEGGGLRVDNSTAWIHDSRFVNNRTNVSGHRTSAAGGAIHVTNARLRVSNTRFSGNRAGCVGGAIYAIGSWSDPVATPAADLLVTNSTFFDNAVVPHDGISCDWTPVGGAIHTEDQTTLKIYSSRFDSNQADIGGALSQYRTILEIYDSQFFDNISTGTGTAGFGGAIMSNSNDAKDDSTNDGAINRRSAQLTIEDSLFVGQTDGVGSNALKGGCVFVEGDMTRTYGNPNAQVPQMGTAATNRATVRIRRSVFTQCRVEEDGVTTGTGAGGALEIGHADLEVTDSLLMANTSVGDSQSSGGGARVNYESTALFQNTTFAHNVAGTRSGALHIFGAHVDIDNCEFFGNQVNTGGPGSAIWARPAPEGWYWSKGTAKNPDVEVSGSVSDSTFADNSGIDIEERDFDGGPMNDLQYSNNRFYGPSAGSTVFTNELVSGGKTVAALNSLTISRSGAADTDKAPSSDNQELGTAPILGALHPTPPFIYQTNGFGDTAPPTPAYLASAWYGGAATIDASPLSGSTGTDLRTGASGSHTLLVSSSAFNGSIATAPIPEATLTANPDVISSGASSDLDWDTWAGAYLEMSLDRAVVVGTTGASGSQSVSPSATTTYNLHLLTKEGGSWDDETVWVNESSAGIFADGFESGKVSAWSFSTP